MFCLYEAGLYQEECCFTGTKKILKLEQSCFYGFSIFKTSLGVQSKRIHKVSIV